MLLRRRMSRLARSTVKLADSTPRRLVIAGLHVQRAEGELAGLAGGRPPARSGITRD